MARSTPGEVIRLAAAAMPNGRLSKTTIAASVCVGTAAWTSLGLLAFTDAAGARRIGVLPAFWVLALLIGIAMATAALIRLPARRSLPLFLSLLIVLPWIPLPLPAVFLVWTGPGVALIWAAIALSLAASGLSTWSRPRLAFLNDRRAAPLVAAVIAFVIFLAVRNGHRLPPTGDEPHYLVIAQSLLYDHDVKVANNYQRRDYFQYYGGLITPHLSRPGVDGALYSVHAPGLPALVAPAFALHGYPAVVVWLALLAALGTAVVWRAGYVVTGEPGAAWFGWAVVALTVPCVLHASLVYPDSVAGALIACAVLALTVAGRGRPAPSGVDRNGGHRRTWRPWEAFGLGLALGMLPWLHTRLALPAAIAALILLPHLWAAGRFSIRAPFFVPILLSAAAWLAFFRVTYGTFNPAAPYGEGVPLELDGIARGFLGLMADQEFGLLPNAPVHLLSIAGVWSLFRRNRRLGLELLLIVVPYTIASSAFPLWSGGSSPPARFLVPVIFPLGMAAASAWAAQGARGRAVSLTLLGASVLIAAAIAFGGDGMLAYNQSTGRARWLDWLTPLVDVPRAFPSAFRATWGSNEITRPALIWALGLLAGFAAFVGLDRKLPHLPSVRALTGPACLAGACALAVTATWRTGGPARNGVWNGYSTATRAQLELLRREDPALRPIGVQLFPPRLWRASDLPRRLMVSSSELDATPPDVFLQLADVPAGSYRVRVARKRPVAGQRGTLTLAIGQGSVPAARWLLSDDRTDYAFDLPISASALVVSGDDQARESVASVALFQRRGRQAPPPTTERARDAARYGSTLVYALDERVSLEGDGFWVWGGRQPDVLIATDEKVGWLNLEAHNGPATNRLRIRSGDWSTERALAPAERWPVQVPLLNAGQGAIVNFDVERAFHPSDFDSSSRDERPLGCWIEVH